MFIVLQDIHFRIVIFDTLMGGTVCCNGFYTDISWEKIGSIVLLKFENILNIFW